MTGKKIMSAIGGVALCSIAVIMFLVGVLAVIDPVGTKMADDGDPFGKPLSHVCSSLICLAAIGMFMGGRWLMRTGNVKRTEAEPPSA